MGYNPGDNYNFILNIPNTLSSAVTSIPVISVLDMHSGSVVVTAQTMTVVGGTDVIYKYNWTIPSSPALNDYVAIVTYAVSPTTFTNQFLKKLHVGDSYIPGMVAQDGTVAKDNTVAKAASTLQASSYVSPDNSPLVNSIQSSVAALPSTLATASSVASIASQVQDLHNIGFGNWIIDKNANTLTLYTVGGAPLQVFNLSNSGTLSERIRA